MNARPLVLACSFLLLALPAAPLAAQQRVIPVDSAAALRQAVAQARAGDRIEIAPGTYELRLSAANLRGEPDRPIVIRGADPDNPPVIHGTMQFPSPQHLVLEHFVLTAAPHNGLNIDDGGNLAEPARGVVLRHLHVHDTGGDGNQDGIKLSGLADFRIEHVRIERWGERGSGIDMVGCRDGVIEHCTIATNVPTGEGIQAKGGSRDIIIRHCTFENAGGRSLNIGGSTGMAFFRPRPEHFEARDITVEHCVFIGSLAPVAFVGVDGAVFRHNTIYRPGRWALRILQETRAEGFVPSRDGVFTDNLIVFRSDEMVSAVNIGPGTAPETFTFARNWWYCEDDPQRSRVELPAAEEDGVYGRDPRTSDEVKDRWLLPLEE